VQKKDIEQKCISERGRESPRCACRDKAEEQKSQEDASRKTLMQVEQRSVAEQ
jgi:hypothetical protein